MAQQRDGKVASERANGLRPTQQSPEQTTIANIETIVEDWTR